MLLPVARAVGPPEFDRPIAPVSTTTTTSSPAPTSVEQQDSPWSYIDNSQDGQISTLDNQTCDTTCKVLLSVIPSLVVLSLLALAIYTFYRRKPRHNSVKSFAKGEGRDADVESGNGATESRSDSRQDFPLPIYKKEEGRLPGYERARGQKLSDDMEREIQVDDANTERTMSGGSGETETSAPQLPDRNEPVKQQKVEKRTEKSIWKKWSGL